MNSRIFLTISLLVRFDFCMEEHIPVNFNDSEKQMKLLCNDKVVCFSLSICLTPLFSICLHGKDKFT